MLLLQLKRPRGQQAQIWPVLAQAMQVSNTAQYAQCVEGFVSLTHQFEHIPTTTTAFKSCLRVWSRLAVDALTVQRTTW